MTVQVAQPAPAFGASPRLQTVFFKRLSQNGGMS
jgi:hypothetical protein